MKRTIKFRAWDKHAQVMSYSDQFPTLSSFWEYVERVGAEVTQYTELKDKNGKEIYQSDHLMSDKGLLMTVFWSNERACFSVRFPNTWGKRLDAFFYKTLWWASSRSEVIGNIYEGKADKKVYCLGKNTGCDHEDKPTLKECSGCPYMTTIKPRKQDKT